MILLMNVDNENSSEIEGTNTQIEGAGILDFELKGNTHQDSYTGKNLFDNVYGQNMNVYTKNIVANNPLGSVSCYPINLLPNTQYTLTVNMNGYEKINTWISGLCFEDGRVISLLQYGTMADVTTTTFTTDSTGIVYVGHRYGYDPDRMKLFLQTAKIQIEKGPTSTEYEKFVGGSPSPSPDYPQPIEVVTGDNTINVHGKNLAKVTNTDIGDTTYSLKISNGLINITTTGSNNSFDLCGGIRTGQWLPTSYDEANDYHLTPANQGTYTLSASNVSATITGTANQTLNIYTNQRRIYKAITYNGTIEDNTFTLQQDEYVKSIYVWTNGVTTINKLELKIQLEPGPTATPYQPYQSKDYEINLGNIELCKIDTYEDKIYSSNGRFYLYKNINKMMIDTTQLNITTSYTNIDYANFPKNNDAINYGVWGHYKVYCNKGIWENITSYDNSEYVNKIASGANRYNYWFGIEKGTTLNEAKELLSNTYVYYILKEPTITEITDTDLIEQLEAISNSALFEGVNYIDLNSDNLIGSYKITYSTWYEFEKILRSGYNINEDNDRITQKFANGHRKQFVSDYKDCIITLNLDTIDIDTTKEYLRQLKSGPYKYYSLENKEYKTAQFIIEKKPELKVNNSIGDNTDIDEYQVTLLRAGD